MYKPSKPNNPEELVTAEGQRLRGGERGENVPVKLAIVYVQFRGLPGKASRRDGELASDGLKRL